MIKLNASSKRSPGNRKLYYRLNVIFILMLLFPCTGFFYFGYRYGFLQEEYTKIFIVIGLLYIFVGFHLLRRIFDDIVNISKVVKEKIAQDLAVGEIDEDQNELQQILQSFNAIETKLRVSSEQLMRRTSQVSILKELSDICYVTLDPWEILYVTLERALMLTGADMGSVLILDRSEGKSFVVKASIGLGERVKMDDRINFDTSIAKYAVINKSPLIVEDIERESRFGRANRLHYGTKSFVIMPIKTIKDVIGVLTISREHDDKVFTESDVESLTPLLSNAAFTYENLRLISEYELDQKNRTALKRIFKALNSSLRDSELLQSILSEVQGVVPFEVAVLLVRHDKDEESLKVLDYMANEAVRVAAGDQVALPGSIFEQVMQKESIMIIDDLDAVRDKIDEKLIVPGLKNGLLAPLTTRGKVTGVMILYARQSDGFQKSFEIVEGIAHIVSFAIDENNLLASIVKRNQELIAIKQIGRALASSTFDMSQVLKYTMDMIRTLMKVEAGFLALVKEAELEFAVSFQIDLLSLQKIRLALGQGISGAVASRGEPILANDAAASIHFDSKIDEITGFRTRSALCVPMISQGKVVGVIEVLNKLDGEFTEDDRDVLQSIATSVSIALENARLYKETVSMAEQERGIRAMFQKFVPKEVVDKIIRDSTTGKSLIDEFKTLTLLNIDIRGFSGIARKIGPQKSVALLNYFFSVMGGIVFKHHGIVDKYLGDGFLALFGAPVATSMDADNALAAAVEMKEAVRAINSEYVEELLHEPVQIGISVYTGEAVVGNIGFEMKMDYTVIGDTVNNVFRLQEITKPVPNSIVIAETTSRAAQSALELRELTATIAGLKTYELLGLKKTSV
ncbi:MAG: GAF domain-containing protein [Desulfobulbaceae bacterium]|jgi:class 3 adenylate cyclase/GAF domain-containing protein|nr:GAF domain-containing protein [Desulfobulbaceae bacterium]MDY0351450.1 GAF domain-containing protein [Desulfobulbaceae bacterium]